MFVNNGTKICRFYGGYFIWSQTCKIGCFPLEVFVQSPFIEEATRHGARLVTSWWLIALQWHEVKRDTFKKRTGTNHWRHAVARLADTEKKWGETGRRSTKSNLLPTLLVVLNVSLFNSDTTKATHISGACRFA